MIFFHQRPPLNAFPVAAAVLVLFGLVGGSRADRGRELASDRTLTLQVTPSQTLVSSHVPTSLHLQILITAAHSFRSTDRLPLNVALVLDRSGSMAGEKIAQARATASRIAERLQPRDRLSLVSYSDRARVDFPSRDDVEPSRINKILRRVRSGGGTNLFAGLQCGVGQVSEHLGPGINRVFLLSDGRANQGIVDPERMLAELDASLERGVTITTLGVGLDFNEWLLSHLARRGRGRFHFIENPRHLAAILTRELRSAERTSARQLELELELSDGIEVEKVYGHHFSVSRGRLRIALRDLFSGEQRKVLLAIRTPPGKAGILSLGSVQLRYRGPDGAHHRLRLSSPIKVGRSDYADEILSSMVPSVQDEILFTSNGELLRQAWKAVGEGSREEAEQMVAEATLQAREACRARGEEKLCLQAQQLQQRQLAIQQAESHDQQQRVMKQIVLDVDAAIEN